MRRFMQDAATTHRCIRTDISMVADYTMVAEHCPRTHPSKSTDPNQGQHGCTRQYEGSDPNLHIGCNGSLGMDDGAPTRVRYTQTFDASNPRGHVFHLLKRGDKKNIAVELLPVFETPQNRNAVHKGAQRQSIIEKTQEFQWPASISGIEYCLCYGESIAGSTEDNVAFTGFDSHNSGPVNPRPSPNLRIRPDESRVSASRWRHLGLGRCSLHGHIGSNEIRVSSALHSFPPAPVNRYGFLIRSYVAP